MSSEAEQLLTAKCCLLDSVSLLDRSVAAGAAHAAASASGQRTGGEHHWQGHRNAGKASAACSHAIHRGTQRSASKPDHA